MKLPEPRQLPDGHWVIRYSAPAGPDGKRRQPRAYGRTAKECAQNYRAAMGSIDAGRQVVDQRTKVAEYLPRWLGWHAAEVKPKTAASYEEIFRLYWIPAIGHLRLADLREEHIRDTHAAMTRLNTPAEEQDRSDLMRRLVQARGTREGQRYRRLPLSKARIRRVTAPLVKALNDCKALPMNPAAGIGGKVPRTRPLLWTAPRVEQWRKDGRRPAAVMVWTRDQCGAFLDSAENDRLYSLYHLAALWGLRMSELAGLLWADLDLGTRRLHVRGDVKSEGSDRVIVIDPGTTDVLRAWRKTQLAERMAWGGAWTDSGRVFTREDGQPLRPAWISEHFKVLYRRAGLPPIRLHDLRHTAATMARAAGVDIKTISANLGHATTNFTDSVYVEVADEMREDAAAKVAAFIPRRAKSVPNGGLNDR